jgi:hypothetical protein
VIAEEPPKTSDPELAAKQAIDEAVATLRSLAEGVQSRPAPRAWSATRLEDSAPREPVPSGEAFSAQAPLGDRLRNGFHRLGLVLALTMLAANGVMLLAFFDLSENPLDIRRALLLLFAAAAAYLLCRSMAWVALGFAGEPGQGDVAAPRPTREERAAPHARTGPRGFGGWLWFPVIAAVVSPLAIGEGLYSAAANFHAVMQGPFEARAFVLLLALLGLGFLVGWLYALVLMARRSRRFPRLYVALSLGSLALFAAGWLIATRYFGYFDWALFLKTGAGEVARAIWVPYLLASRRVRNTFVT